MCKNSGIMFVKTIQKEVKLFVGWDNLRHLIDLGL